MALCRLLYWCFALQHCTSTPNAGDLFPCAQQLFGRCPQLSLMVSFCQIATCCPRGPAQQCTGYTGTKLGEREGAAPFCSVPGRPHLQCCAQAWGPQGRRDAGLLERVQRRAREGACIEEPTENHSQEALICQPKRELKPGAPTSSPVSLIPSYATWEQSAARSQSGFCHLRDY